VPVRVPRRGLVGRPRLWAAAGLWALFAVQTGVVARWPDFFLDTALDDMVISLRVALAPGEALQRAAGLVARLGAREVLIPLALVAGAVLGRCRRSLWPPAFLAASYLLVAGVTGLVKVGLARPQPIQLLGVPGRAFPSGHAAQATVVFGALALLLAVGHGPEWRRRAILAAGAVVLLVSVALLWRRAHWLTDMVGGATLGVACVASVGAAREWLADRSTRPLAHSVRE
jgi:membrane-associated phospholipid phosphatase